MRLAAAALLLAVPALAQTTETTIFPPPENLNATAPDCRTAELAWTNPTGAPPAPIHVAASARCDGAIVATFERGYAYPQDWTLRVRPVGGDWETIGDPGPDLTDGAATNRATLGGLCAGDYEVAICATNASFPTAPSICSEPVAVTVPAPGLDGDCNADGRVTTADVTCMILRLFEEIGQRSVCEDCNGDGILTTADVTCAILKAVGA